MQDMSDLLSDPTPEFFADAFRSGLARLLSQDGRPLSDLVLVLANAVALGDEGLFEQVRIRFARLEPQLAPADRADEDATILRFALARTHPQGFVHRRVTAGGWQVLASELRNFRPRREAARAAGPLHQPFDAGRFNFGRVGQQAFLQDTFGGTELALYYQKYPLMAYHCMAVPQPQAGHEQFLQPADHQLAWELVAALQPVLPGAIVAYNSLGAFASINHLHFHIMPNGTNLPIWSRLDAQTYPLPATLETNQMAAWKIINQLQNQGQTFNLLYRPGQIAVIPRRAQGTYHQPDWTSGLAWFELAGGIFVTNQTAFTTLTDAQIEAALNELAP
jgi:diadenosine tetraphosphate (Ap4A) HIT family hydrolase